MPAQLRRAPTFADQPLDSALTRINPRHWLAKDLVFVHSGRQAFVEGAPVQPPASPILGYTHPTNRGRFSDTSVIVPDGTTTQFYDISPINYPYTLVSWMWGKSGRTSSDSFLAIRRSKTISAGGGSSIRIVNDNRFTAASHNNTATVTNAFALAGAHTVQTWQQVIGSYANDVNRRLIVDGVFLANNTTSRTHNNAVCVVLLENSSNTTAVCSTDTGGVALPLVLRRALSDDEAARLYAEQLSNPWALFAERPRMIWLGAGAAPGIPTLSALARTNLRRPRYTWTP